jgi:hypothetical protein
MRKVFFLIVLFAFSAFLLSGCKKEESETTEPIKEDIGGRISISSNPSKAKIFLMNVDTKKVTTDSLLNLDAGTYEITLTRTDYIDTTFLVTVHNKIKTNKSIVLKSIFDGDITYEIAKNSPFTNYVITFFLKYKTDIYLKEYAVTNPKNTLVTSQSFDDNEHIFRKNIRQKLSSYLFGNGQSLSNPSGTWSFYIMGHSLGEGNKIFSNQFEVNVQY